MVTGSVDIERTTVLTGTFGDTEIRGMDAFFWTAFEIVINVQFQVFLLLRSRLDFNETMMRSRHDFLADFTMDVPAACMSFE
jgi:hypothetical protein